MPNDSITKIKNLCITFSGFLSFKATLANISVTLGITSKDRAFHGITDQNVESLQRKEHADRYKVFCLHKMKPKWQIKIQLLVKLHSDDKFFTTKNLKAD